MLSTRVGTPSSQRGSLAPELGEILAALETVDEQVTEPPDGRRPFRIHYGQVFASARPRWMTVADLLNTEQKLKPAADAPARQQTEEHKTPDRK